MQSPAAYWQALPRNTKQFLMGCGLVSLVLHLLAAVYSTGFYRYDEHYQIIEFAWMKLGRSTLGNMAWEYPAMSRPSLQPWIAIEVFKAMGMTDPFKMAFVLRLFSSLVGFASLIPFCLLVLQWIKNDILQKVFPVLLATFTAIPFIHARFSSEGFGCTFLLWGICFLLLSQTVQSAHNKGKIILYLLLSGASLAVAFVCRIQMAMAFPGMLIWAVFLEKIPLKKLFWAGVSFGLVLVFCAILDRFYYGVWLNTLWLYFKINFLEGKANSFGTSPFMFYFNDSIHRAGFLWGWFFALIVLAGWARKPFNIFTLAYAPYFLLHCFIGHKELRFLYPMVCALPLFVVFAVDGFKIKPIMSWKMPAKITISLLLLVFFVSWLTWVADACLSPASLEFSAYKYMDRYRDEKLVFISLNDQESPYGPKDKLNLDFYKPHDLVVKYHMPDAGQIKQVTDTSAIPVYLYTFSQDLHPPETLVKSGVHYQLEYYSLPAWVLAIKSWHILGIQPSVLVYRLTK